MVSKRIRVPLTSRGGGFGVGAILLVSLALGACVKAQFVPTSEYAYAPRSLDCEVEVFSSALPDREYEEIGIVEGTGSHWKADLQDLLPKLREQACLAGGDAVLLLDSDVFSEGEDGHPVLRSSATVIRWTRGS